MRVDTPDEARPAATKGSAYGAYSRVGQVTSPNSPYGEFFVYQMDTMNVIEEKAPSWRGHRNRRAVECQVALTVWYPNVKVCLGIRSKGNVSRVSKRPAPERVRNGKSAETPSRAFSSEAKRILPASYASGVKRPCHDLLPRGFRWNEPVKRCGRDGSDTFQSMVRI
jgi:hypothetical protein